MSRNIIILTLLAVVSLSSTASAEQDFTDFNTLARYLVYGSPSSDLVMIEADTRCAELSTEGNLPDPTVEGEFLAPQKSGESNRWGVSADWSLEWPGVYGARREQARLESESAQAAASAALERRVQEVQSILVDLQFNDTSWNLLKQMLDDTDSLAVSVRRAHLGGELSRIDLDKIRIERARLFSRMEQLAADSHRLAATLSSDYGIPREALPTFILCNRLPLAPLEYYLARYDSLSQSAQYRSSTLAAEAAVKVARREALPGIGIGYRHAYEDASHFNGAAVSVSVPLFSSKGKKKAAELRAFTAASEERIARQNWTEQIRATYDLALLLDYDIKEIKAPIAEGYNADLLRRAYEGGEWSLIQYLQERAFFTEAMFDLIELERAYNQAVTTLLGF